MHWTELINNSIGKYSFLTARRACTQNVKHRGKKSRRKDKVVPETNSSGCHDDIDRAKQLPSKYTFTFSWTAGKLQGSW